MRLRVRLARWFAGRLPSPTGYTVPIPSAGRLPLLIRCVIVSNFGPTRARHILPALPDLHVQEVGKISPAVSVTSLAGGNLEAPTSRNVSVAWPPCDVRNRPLVGGERKPSKVVRPRRVPIKRGGRPRDHVAEQKEKRETEPGGRVPRPEIVCWEEGWRWFVGVEVPEGLGVVEVRQDGGPLASSRDSEMLYPLRRLGGCVTIHAAEVDDEITLGDEAGSPLVFKTRKNWKGPGRLVSCCGTGYYLLVAPEDWHRSQATSGPAAVREEKLHIRGYLAHFFHRERSGDPRPSFLNQQEELVPVETVDPRFRLVGSEIPDASTEMGPLFGSGPPRIQALDENGWDSIGVVVLGEEGGGRGRWRDQFSPQKSAREQTLPDSITNRRGGWYFVRIYDTEDNLLESMDFRFMTALRDIRLSAYSCLPGRNGHERVTIDFHHGPTFTVKLRRAPSGSLPVSRQGERTSAVIPADPAWDVTDWELSESNARVEVEVMVERVWWSFRDGVDGRQDSDQEQWLHLAAPVERGWFGPTSAKTVRIWLPRPRYGSQILVGFSSAASRSFRTKVSERFVDVPLRDFCDASEITNVTRGAELKLWLPSSQERADGVATCTIREATPKLLPKPPPPVPPQPDPLQMQCCLTCDHARSQNHGYWCRRYHWPRVGEWVFEQEFARHSCAEWRGEYRDADGRYHAGSGSNTSNLSGRHDR